MKKSTIFLGLILILSLPVAAFSATIKSGNEYTLKLGEVVSDNLYLATGNGVLLGNTLKDALLAGGNLSVDGRVGGDLFTAGGTLTLDGEVGDDFRFLGGNLTLKGKVNGELVLAGGEAHLVSGSRVGGDLLSAAGRLVLDGDIAGKVTAAGGEVVINGHVRGPISLWSNRVIVGENAVIEGDLFYRSTARAEIDPKAVIRGQTTFKSINESPVFEKDHFLKFFETWRLLFLFAFILTGLIFLKFIPKIFRDIVFSGLASPGNSVLWGVLGLILLPPLVFVLAITVIGLPLSFLIFLSYFKLLIIAKVFAGTIFGVWLIKLAFRLDHYEVTWQAVVGGLMILSLLGRLPYLGFLLNTVFYFIGFGAGIIFIYRKIFTRAS